jgi:putative transposase
MRNGLAINAYHKSIPNVSILSSDPFSQGWLYLVAVLDLFPGGLSVGPCIKSSMLALSLPLYAWALAQRRPVKPLIIHSDRGAQFASVAYRQILAQHGLIASMARKGNCYDNAFIESFWSSLKYELVYHRRFATLAEARSAIFHYIETFYNRIQKNLKLSLPHCPRKRGKPNLTPSFPPSPLVNYESKIHSLSAGLSG